MYMQPINFLNYKNKFLRFSIRSLLSSGFKTQTLKKYSFKPSKEEQFLIINPFSKSLF